jgi:cytochrome c-type biogenesis protein CcmF
MSTISSFTDIGNIAMVLTWLLALVGIILSIISGRSAENKHYNILRQVCILNGLLATLSLAGLGYAFITSDYTNQYVWQHSNTAMSSWYKFSAIWGGMDGSMLLWAGILAINVALVGFFYKQPLNGLMPWTLGMLLLSELFFFSVVVFFTNPFRYLVSDVIPLDGNGLNPLLQNPYMAIHPPTLYLGFTTLTVPYAFCIGALLSGSLSTTWITLTRRWTLVAWAFLTAGIVMGGHWAYMELGWGGFWAWDPVENASFLPWLTGTAFLHSVMVQKQKGMLKIWNVWLVVLTYALTVLGTFLTRSGIVQSVHAFAATDIGEIFIIYLVAIVLIALSLTIYRRKELRPERNLESVFSRETVFLINNLILLSICFATLWGVLFPVLSEAITGSKQAVSAPFFNKINVPLFMALIFFMGIGPMISWKKTSLNTIRKTFLKPFILSLIIGGALVAAGVESYWATLSYSLCWFVASTILIEFYRAYKAQKEEQSAGSKVVKLIKKQHVRYAGLLVHLGVIVMTVGITASMAHKVEEEFVLGANQEFSIGSFTLKLVDLKERDTKNYASLYADVEVKKRSSQEKLTNLQPEMRSYFRNQETTNEVAIRTGLLQDLYLVLVGLDDSGEKAAFKVFINPLQVWLWIGTIIVLVGTGLAMLPSKNETAPI